MIEVQLAALDYAMVLLTINCIVKWGKHGSTLALNNVGNIRHRQEVDIMIIRPGENVIEEGSKALPYMKFVSALWTQSTRWCIEHTVLPACRAQDKP